MRFPVKAAVLTAAAVLFFQGSGFSRDITAGTKELSGTAGLYVFFQDNITSAQVDISPSFAYYPSEDFFFGPLISYRGSKSGAASWSDLGMGVHIGVLISRKGNPLPYADIGALLLKSNNDSEDYSGSANGKAVNLNAGLKFRLSDSFFLNLQLSYIFSRIRTYDLTTFLVGVGVSGIF